MFYFVEIKEIELDVVGRCAKISYKLYGGEKAMKKVLLVMVLVFSFVLVEPMVMSQAAVTIEAAAKTKLQYKSDEIGVNGKTEISILNKKPKAKYIYSSNKKSVATVSLKGIITGKSVGTAKIIVKQKLGGKETQIGVFTVKVKKASLYSHIKKENNGWCFSVQPGELKESPIIIKPERCIKYLNPKANYYFYSDNRNLVITKSGRITDIKNSGKAILTIKEVYKGKKRVIGKIPVQLKNPTYTGPKTLQMYVGRELCLSEYLEGVSKCWFTMSDKKLTQEEVVEDANQGIKNLGDDVIGKVTDSDGNWDGTLKAKAAGTRYCYITQYNYITKKYDKIFGEFVIMIPDTSKLEQMKFPWEYEDYEGNFNVKTNTLIVDVGEEECIWLNIEPEHYSGPLSVTSSNPDVVSAGISYDSWNPYAEIELIYHKIGTATITVKVDGVEKSYNVLVF